MQNKTCLQCHKKYTPWKKEQKYCSRICFGKARKGTGKQEQIYRRRCKQCASTFHVKYVKRNLTKYCSQKCYGAACKGRPNMKNRTGKNKSCKKCQKSYYKPKTLLKTTRYCSFECFNEIRRVYITCIICGGKDFYPQSFGKNIQKPRCTNCRKLRRGNYVFCQKCRKRFYVEPAKYKLVKNFYCSIQCYGAYPSQEGILLKSAREQMIDTFLHVHNIPHEHEKRISQQRLFRCDFYINDLYYVEYFGLYGNYQTKREIEYKKKMKEKLNYYKKELPKQNKKLIALYPKDLKNLERALLAKIK